nr:heme-binding protein [Ramlibacter algicola]
MLATAVGAAFAQGTYEQKAITPEAALKAAQAALASCRGAGFAVAVAVADRAGVPIVLLRDRFAGPHTADTAVNKAWTAASFRMDTLALARETQAGQPSSGIRQLPRVVAVGGGRTIEAAGSLVGGIGVSGAPGGDADDQCARAGLQAVAADLDF